MLRGAGLMDKPTRVSEMSAGFCNWVYRVDLPDREPVVVKFFSPMAKLRVAPELRGQGDQAAGAESLGPLVHFRSPDGMVIDYVEGDTLTERDMHAPASDLPELIAPKLAKLHASGDYAGGGDAVGGQSHLWQFLDAMMDQVAAAKHALPSGISFTQIEREIARMRARCDVLGLKVVPGHGDLKPSNVMRLRSPARDAERDGGIFFIDFELAGAHYRAFDLFKLFRTAEEPSVANMRAFLRSYLAAGREEEDEEELLLELEALQAEAYVAEPLTWLEAAVFFFFATSVDPSQTAKLQPLALQRWERYLATAPLVDVDGEATCALAKARDRLSEFRRAPGPR